MDLSAIKASTVFEVIDQLCAQLSKEEIATIKRRPDAADYHRSVGMALRNELGLWNKETPVVKTCAASWGVTHGDDVSGLILSGVIAKVRGKRFNFEAEVERYRHHWATQGLQIDGETPLDSKNLPPPGGRSGLGAWVSRGLGIFGRRDNLRQVHSS